MMMHCHFVLLPVVCFLVRVSGSPGGHLCVTRSACVLLRPPQNVRSVEPSYTPTMAAVADSSTNEVTGPISHVGLGAVCRIVPSVTPPKVPNELHAENRARVVASMLESGAKPTGAIVMEGGHAVTRDDTDHEPLFRQESNFQYLFGVREPDCFAVIFLDTGKTALFIPRLPPVYAVFMGEILPPSHFQSVYGFDEAYYVDDIPSVLKEHKSDILYTFHGLNTDSGNYAEPANFEGIEEFETDKDLLFGCVVERRVIKTKREQDLMCYVNAITCEAHMAVMAHVRPGMKEYQCESLFQHWCYYNGGARNMSYTCICGTGKNGGTLHYGHAAAPNDKTIVDGDMCLFDMGCEYHCYASDVTCSFPANGKFTDDQRMIYNSVLAAQRAVMDALKPGVNWKDMHELSYRTALTCLKDGGLLQGDVEEMMAVNLGATLMPHGLGHFMGLDTHDVGGYWKGLERDSRDGFRSLRTIRDVAAGMVLTVEPGIYFINHLLKAAMEDPEKEKFFVKETLARFWTADTRSFGGVRLEDDIIITEDGILNMTIAPRTVEEVEAVMAGEIVERLSIPAYKSVVGGAGGE